MTKDKTKAPQPTEPKDVVDGIPDRSPRRRPLVVAAVLLVFALWVAFLAWVTLAGGAV